MFKALVFIIDIFFPPTREELLIRALSPHDFLKKARTAPISPLSFASSLFAYKDPLVRELIWQIKYKKNRHAAHIAATALYTRLLEFSSRLTLVPIPISKKRRRERGYNQCELIIDEIMKLDQEKRFLRDYSLLIRSKHIERQTLKGRTERLKNAKGIFEAREKEDREGATQIIIIDDVMTTGSTAKEARETLLAAGYKNVGALTIAH
jgi:ComF family protein